MICGNFGIFSWFQLSSVKADRCAPVPFKRQLQSVSGGSPGYLIWHFTSAMLVVASLMHGSLLLGGLK